MSSHRSGPRGEARRTSQHIRSARLLVLVVALVVLVPKLVIAARTYGTEDILTWTRFAHGVKLKGPVGVYSINFMPTAHTIYNHPPLMGWYLELANILSRHGVALKFTIRAISSSADVVSALLCFEILRRRTSLLRATSSGVLIAASPVLFLISGYHGNTDPLFVMLALMGAFLIVDKDKAILGGVAIALALSVKVVPIVVVPTMAVYLLRHRRDLLLKATAGFGVVFLALWTGPVLTQWQGLDRNVIGYAGVATRQWGLVQMSSAQHADGLTAFLIGPGRILAVVIASFLPAAFVWRHREYAIEGSCFALVSFLTLSPAFGVQYLAWTLAAAYILDFWLGTIYSLVAGVFLYIVYDHWNHGLPWTHVAAGRLFTETEINLGLLVWSVLAVLVLVQIVRGVLVSKSTVTRGPGGRSTVGEVRT